MGITTRTYTCEERECNADVAGDTSYWADSFKSAGAGHATDGVMLIVNNTMGLRSKHFLYKELNTGPVNSKAPCGPLIT